MSDADASAPGPRWLQVAQRLERLAAGPSEAQQVLAGKVGFTLPSVPAPVAAALLQHHLQAELGLPGLRGSHEIPEVLREIESDLGIEEPAELVTGTRSELQAWFRSRYMVKTAQGLRALRPEAGDIVALSGEIGACRASGRTASST